MQANRWGTVVLIHMVQDLGKIRAVRGFFAVSEG